jgi:hypothetical protein
MRITIELTEAEARATTIRPEHIGAAGADAPAEDGGPPSEALLIALGAATADGTEAGACAAAGGDAGGPPAWLVEVVAGGREPPA